MLSGLLCADDLALMSESNEGLRNRFLKYEVALKVILGKTNVMVSSSITKHGWSKSKVDPCGVCGLRVKAHSVLCVHCGK